MSAFAGPGFGPGVNRPSISQQQLISGWGRSKRLIHKHKYADVACYVGLEKILAERLAYDLVGATHINVELFGRCYIIKEAKISLAFTLPEKSKIRK